jgi:hypothetical protein
MTAPISAIILFAVLIGGFVLVGVWLARQSDRLAARHRGLGVLIWIIASLMLTALILHFAAPSSAPRGSLVRFMMLMLLYAIWQRRRFSRQLQERRNKSLGST